MNGERIVFAARGKGVKPRKTQERFRLRKIPVFRTAIPAK